jgi:nicotinate-nucleotide adenylyltransferase
LKKGSPTSLKIGLFGGTFNPVHLGHLRAAEEIREAYGLSRIIFVPAHLPPHKKNRVTPARHRIAMVRQAIRRNPFFSVSDVELRRAGSSYSFETIQYFNRRLKSFDELFFIIGIDAFREIDTWKQYPDFFSACNFIVMERPGQQAGEIGRIIPADAAADFTGNRAGSCFVHRSGYRVLYHSITLLAISSTAVRLALREGRSVRYLVPEAVARYVQKNNLYYREK